MRAALSAERRGPRPRGAERGSALIETAVSLPLLLMVMLGIAQMGVVFHQYLVLTDAVRVAARQLAISRIPSITNPCQVAVTRLNTSAASLPGAIGVVVSLNGVDRGTTCNNVGMQEGWEGEVRATYPCNLQIFGVDYAPGCVLRAETTVVIE